MKIEKSYFVKIPHGDVLINAWLAIGVEMPEGAIIIEERPMLLPDMGKMLRNKENGEISHGHWMRGDDNMDKWDEVEDSEE